ncbi:hypothetical protein Gotur_009939, partial [Gossypium turneri]
MLLSWFFYFFIPKIELLHFIHTNAQYSSLLSAGSLFLYPLLLWFFALISALCWFFVLPSVGSLFLYPLPMSLSFS